MYSPGLWGGSIVRSTVALVGDVRVVGDGRDKRYFKAYKQSQLPRIITREECIHLTKYRVSPSLVP
jgi:hypothetical protein